MAAYLVVETTGVSDPDGIGQYVAQVSPLVERLGGRYIARGPAHVLEGSYQPLVMVIVEFDSVDQIKALYDSPEYAPLKDLRMRSSVSSFLAVDGL